MSHDLDISQSEVGEWLTFLKNKYPPFLHYKCSVNNISNKNMHLNNYCTPKSLLCAIDATPSEDSYVSPLVFLKCVKRSAREINPLGSTRETFDFWRVGDMTIIHVNHSTSLLSKVTNHLSWQCAFADCLLGNAKWRLHLCPAGGLLRGSLVS